MIGKENCKYFTFELYNILSLDYLFTVYKNKTSAKVNKSCQTGSDF